MGKMNLLEKEPSFIVSVNEAMRHYEEMAAGRRPDTLLLHNDNGRGSPFFYSLYEQMKSSTGVMEIHFHDFANHKKMTLLGLDVAYSDIIISKEQFAVYQRNDEKFYQLRIGKVEIYPIFKAPIPRSMLKKVEKQ